MEIIEIYYEDVNFRQFPFGLADWGHEISLKADKGRTTEEREQFKQQVLKDIEADRLMMAQSVHLFIVGVSANYVTPWGGPPVTGRVFEDDAIDALLAVGNGNPFVIHSLAYETSQRANRLAVRNPEALRPLKPGEQLRRLSRTEVEAVVADKDAVVQAALEEVSQRYGFSWEAESL